MLKVSVLVVTYNHAKFIAQALDSILMQKVDFEYEIVVGEDCSTDSTRDIVLRFQEKYPGKFHLILSEKNVGAAKNFECAYKACKGEYIAYLDGDDYWTDPLKLQKQVRILDQKPDVFICGHWNTVVDNNEKITAEWRFPEYFDIKDALRGPPVHINSWLFRRIDIYSYKRCCDVMNKLSVGDDPIMLLFLSFGKGYCLQESCSVYRLHEGGIWSTRTDLDKCLYILSLFVAGIVMIPPRLYCTQLDNIAFESYQLLRNLVISSMHNRSIKPFKELLNRLAALQTMSKMETAIVLLLGLAYAPYDSVRYAYRRIKSIAGVT